MQYNTAHVQIHTTTYTNLRYCIGKLRFYRFYWQVWNVVCQLDHVLDVYANLWRKFVLFILNKILFQKLETVIRCFALFWLSNYFCVVQKRKCRTTSLLHRNFRPARRRRRTIFSKSRDWRCCPLDSRPAGGTIFLSTRNKSNGLT